VWMAAVAGFVVTSGLCGLAWSAESLIAFRVLQGLAGGMIMPIGMITLAQAAGPQRMGRVMSVVGVPMLLGPVLGPVIGGLIVEHLSWRWIFYVNLPVGVVGLVLAARLLPSTRAEGTRGVTTVPPELDWKGLLMLSPGVAMLVFGLSEVGAHGRVEGPDVAWMAAGLVLIAAFVRHAWRARFPLVEVRLFRGRGFSAAAATVFFVGGALFGAQLLLPLYYQVARGESPLRAGLLVAPQGLGAALGMRYAGRLTDRIGGGRVVLGGLVVLLLGTFVFTEVGATTSYWLLASAVVVRGIGLGFTMMPAMAAAYSTLQANQVPRATPMLNVVQRIGGSIGTALLAVVLQRQLAAAIPGPAGGLEGARGLPPAAQAKLAGPVATAFAQTYWWSLALTAVAVIPAVILALSERRARAAAQAPSPAASLAA